MTEFFDRDDVLTAGALAVGAVLEVGDFGLLDAAVARPQATVYGVDAYPDLYTKAAALLQSLARNHALVDGNKANRPGVGVDVLVYQRDRACGRV